MYIYFKSLWLIVIIKVLFVNVFICILNIIEIKFCFFRGRLEIIWFDYKLFCVNCDNERFFVSLSFEIDSNFK